MRFKQIIGESKNIIKENTSFIKLQKHTKFSKLIDSFKLTEQTAEEINAAAQDAALDPTLAQTQEVQQEPVPAPEQPKVNTLTAEGEVELIRLLRTALTLDIDPNIIPLEIINVEINQNNARDVYDKLKKFMSTFSE